VQKQLHMELFFDKFPCFCVRFLNEKEFTKIISEKTMYRAKNQQHKTITRWSIVSVILLLALIFSGCPGVGENPPADEPVNYSISYNANSATSGTVPADQSKTEGVDLTLASNTGSLVRSGYTFAGWNTAALGDGTDYTEGSTYSSDANLTLYAKWTTVMLPFYTVTYNANEATSGTAPANQTKTEGVDLTLASNIGSLVRSGYTFAGWNTAALGDGTDYTEGSTYSSDANLTLYAKWIEPKKLLPSDGAAGDMFGSVSIFGDYAIAGAAWDDDNGADSGSAYIFHKTGINTWDSGIKLTASDGEAGDWFGVSVAISGDYAIAGAVEAAYIYHRTSTNLWDTGIKLTANDGVTGNNFGVSVAISGDYAIIGADQDSTNGTESGSAYIYHKTGTNAWEFITKILSDDGAAEDEFGKLVAIDGDYIVISAPYDDDNYTNSGSVYIYHKTVTNTWEFSTKITASDSTADDSFGFSVAISGNDMIVGAPGDYMGTGSGAAYIFHKTDTTWDSGTKITASDGASGDLFGFWTIGISGDNAIVGAHHKDDNGSNSGAAYMFHRTGTTWNSGTKITASDGAEGDEFGLYVALDSEYFIVGARLDDDNGTDSGSAYVNIIQ